MWSLLARITLRNKLPILLGLALVTVFMAYHAANVKLDYNLPRLLPHEEKTNLDFERFVEVFGSHGNLIVLGIQDDDIYKLEKFNALYDMGNAIKALDGVEDIVSIAHAYNLTKKDKAFDFKPIIAQKPRSQAELDSIREVINSLPFYEGVIVNSGTGALLIAVTLDKERVNSEHRKKIVFAIRDKVHAFEDVYGINVKFSGLPYIRTGITVLLKSEMKWFTIAAALLAAIILYAFFRSLRVVAVSLLIVAIGVVWSIGSISLFGYLITGLSGIIPPLIIVIGITNCIYLLNKYHQEHRSHGNKTKALTRVVQKIGSATFMTNTTTAIGFATFILTKSQVLIEFGIIASMNIMLVFVLSILLIPIVFSYLPPPKKRHTKHLDYKLVAKILNGFALVVNNRRPYVYVATAILIVIGIVGVTKMKTTGNLTDDLPKNDPARVDLTFFEEHFGGVMPFEILVDTKKKRGAMQLKNIKKIEKLNQMLAGYDEFSKPISLTEVVKFSHQAFYNGRTSKYTIPTQQKLSFILPYAQKQMDGDKLLNTLVDSTKQIARISVRIKDLKTTDMKLVKDEIKLRIDSIFDPEKYDVTLTGSSVVYLEGTGYLVKGLFISLALAVFLIAVLMAIMFASFRMVLVSLSPNIIPLILTAAIMGYLDISLKPSTILVFSIALGISVDSTIHFLAKYRQELKSTAGNINKSVNTALQETGVSMIYTSIVLFCGFGIFAFSEFGGTRALGILVSITLLLAVLANLLFLPSLLLSLEKAITTRSFKDQDPMIEIIEEDIAVNDPKISPREMGLNGSEKAESAPEKPDV
ncbi:MAG: MMPL family transporter [Flavobacteriales bacterium]|nr:MMPL family transporter [Flavobacteriales bacterium]